MATINYREYVNNDGIIAKKAERLWKSIQVSTRAVMSEMAFDERVIGLAIGVGLVQGLKYKGSFKRGAIAFGAMYAISQGVNICRGTKEVYKILKQDEEA